MFNHLLGILRNPDLERQLGSEFEIMMQRATAVVVEGGEYFWGKPVTQDLRLGLYGRAELVVDLHSSLRNLLVVHAPLPTSTDRSHFLGLITLIREVERLVERGKNLVELARIGSYPLPDDDVVRELRQLRRSVETLLVEVPELLRSNDVRRAQQVDKVGRDAIRRYEEVIGRVATGDYTAAQAISLGMGARIYSRAQKQLLNIVSSITTPLHLVDFFDERPAGAPLDTVY